MVQSMKRKILTFIIAFMLLIILWCTAYILTGYREDATALSSLESNDSVTVTETDYGWLFDGPSDSSALIFYPGAKVNAASYAPILRLLAENGMDVCLVKMPLRIAIFGENKAASVMEEYNYSKWYIGGHSLGGAIASDFACKNPDKLEGVILLAAYPFKDVPEDLKMLVIYGSEDEVINVEKIKEGRELAPTDYKEVEISGGNHAGFGSYGKQRSDGDATISPLEQWIIAVDEIVKFTS